MTSIKRAAAKASEAMTSPSDDAASEIGEPSAVDAMWAAMMIPHHQTGIQMAEMAIKQAATEELRQAAEESRKEQEDDLPQLQRIIDAAGKSPMPPEKAVEKMNKHETKLLESLSGTEFDRHWITVVNGHHMAAIMMTDTAVAGSTSKGAHALQTKLREAQLGEIDKLTDLHQKLHG